nr:MAG TPA: hypothetical protein [Caudoviricetes sp.]
MLIFTHLFLNSLSLLYTVFYARVIEKLYKIYINIKEKL